MPASDPLSTQTNMTTPNNTTNAPILLHTDGALAKALAYTVTADYLPFRRWQVDAFSAIEACMEVHALTSIAMDQLEAAK